MPLDSKCPKNKLRSFNIGTSNPQPTVQLYQLSQSCLSSYFPLIRKTLLFSVCFIFKFT